MPLAFDLTSTLVMGVTLPVATTLLARSPLLHFGEFRGINLGAAPRRREDTDGDQQDNDRDHAAPDNQSATLLLMIAVTVHNASCRYRQVEMGSHFAALTPLYGAGAAFVPSNAIIFDQGPKKTSRHPLIRVPPAS